MMSHQTKWIQVKKRKMKMLFSCANSPPCTVTNTADPFNSHFLTKPCIFTTNQQNDWVRWASPSLYYSLKLLIPQKPVIQKLSKDISNSQDYTTAALLVKGNTAEFDLPKKCCILSALSLTMWIICCFFTASGELCLDEMLNMTHTQRLGQMLS